MGNGDLCIYGGRDVLAFPLDGHRGRYVRDLECLGLHTVKETLRKRLKQTSDGLPRFRHVCCDCKAIFPTVSLAALREQYNAGYEAGFGLYSSAQSRRRNDLARRNRRRRRSP